MSDNRLKLVVVASVAMLCAVVYGLRYIGLDILGDVLVFWGIGGVFFMNAGDSRKTLLYKAFPIYVWVDLYLRYYTRKNKKKQIIDTL
jgi:hypothetical protein